MKNSFFRTMIEEKNLIDEIIIINLNEKLNIFDMDVLIQEIENLPSSNRKVIKNQMSKLDFFNGDMMDYLKTLASVLLLDDPNYYEEIKK